MGNQHWSGWWFGTFFNLSTIYGIILPIDELICFKMVKTLKPPTGDLYPLINTPMLGAGKFPATFSPLRSASPTPCCARLDAQLTSWYGWQFWVTPWMTCVWWCCLVGALEHLNHQLWDEKYGLMGLNLSQWDLRDLYTDWCFGTWLDCDFPYVGECHHPNWLSYVSEGLKHVETTNQLCF